MSWMGLGRQLEEFQGVGQPLRGGRRCWTVDHVFAVAPLCCSLEVEQSRDSWVSSPDPPPTFFTNRVSFYLEKQCDKWKHIYQYSLYPSVACEQPIRCKPKSLGVPSRKVLFLFVGTFTWEMPFSIYPISLLESRHNTWKREAMLWPQGNRYEDKSHKLIVTEWGKRKSLLWALWMYTWAMQVSLMGEKVKPNLIKPLMSGSITYN